MTYALPQDMVDRFGEDEMIQLTDRSNVMHQVDGQVLAAALDDARGEVDVYVGAAYRLPLPRVPRVLQGWACDIARYRLFGDRATDQVIKRYDDAIKALRMVSKRELQLGADLAASIITTTTEPVGPVVVRPGSGTVFSARQLNDYT